jgi:hypothetical protein
MAATVEYCESNGATETVTHNLPALPTTGGTDMGSVDQALLSPQTNRILAGANSYEKWQRVHVTALGGSAAVRTIKVWLTGTPSANTTHHYNGSANQPAYDGANHKQTVYAQPATTATRTPEASPTSEPAQANIGIGGSLTGTLSAPGYSDYILHQIRTTAAATAGATLTWWVAYEEVA